MIDTPSTTNEHNSPIYSVGEISGMLKQTVEQNFQRVRVRGEISGFKRPASGHLYFALKDDQAVMDGICWKGTAGRLGLRPEDGMEVIATGRLTTYPGRSKYQMVVETMELAGEGALLKLLEDRRKRLTEEGLFDATRKQKLPILPRVIGVVTSPTGAVIRDILHRLEDRFPCHVLVWPTRVQGEGADTEIAAAIEGFNALEPRGNIPRPDLLIIARGGGSLEDLWSFNEEIVVRAAASSSIPLISAIGHETDTTLIDFASDRRAPTPTAAAEIAVPVRQDLLAQVMDNGTRLLTATNHHLREKKTALEGLARGLPNLGRMIETGAQRLDEWSERLEGCLLTGMTRNREALAILSNRLIPPQNLLSQCRSNLDGTSHSLRIAAQNQLGSHQARLDKASALLESYSYERVLERGFVLVTDRDSHPVVRKQSTEPGMDLTLHFHDGAVNARIPLDMDAPLKPKPKKFPKKSDKNPDNRQGELL